MSLGCEIRALRVVFGTHKTNYLNTVRIAVTDSELVRSAESTVPAHSDPLLTGTGGLIIQICSFLVDTTEFAMFVVL